jgi:hypothetical protein
MYDLESLSFVQAQARKPALLEYYRGTDIVGWWGKIEKQIQKYVDEASEARNYTYADKLREFLKTWREHELTGSINIETVEALIAASAQVAVDPWIYRDYFSVLRDQLRRLKASVEELPMTDIVPPAERAPGLGAPPSEFGGTREAPLPAGAEGAAEMPEAPGAVASGMIPAGTVAPPVESLAKKTAVAPLL